MVYQARNIEGITLTPAGEDDFDALLANTSASPTARKASTSNSPAWNTPRW